MNNSQVKKKEKKKKCLKMPFAQIEKNNVQNNLNSKSSTKSKPQKYIRILQIKSCQFFSKKNKQTTKQRQRL